MKFIPQSATKYNGEIFSLQRYILKREYFGTKKKENNNNLTILNHSKPKWNSAKRVWNEMGKNQMMIIIIIKKKFMKTKTDITNITWIQM